jgi:hypothetical protein
MQPQDIQSDFYKNQQTRFQEVEPNRLLGRRIAGQGTTPLGVPFIAGATKLLSAYDPYTGNTKQMLQPDAVNQVLSGQDDTTEEERRCREYMGISGLQQLVREQVADPYAPVRCGWRYKPSSVGPIPEVAQGALGTMQGPLNTNAPEDALGSGVEWIWDLQKAEEKLLTDAARQLSGRDGFTIKSDVANGIFTDQLGYCTTTNATIPIVNGQAKYPNHPTTNCAAANIITNPANLPPKPASTSGPAAFTNSRFQPIVNCKTTSNPLTRDCLLQAIRLNGCSDGGSLYTALQMANPSSSKWDDFLKRQNAFQTYQSRQGSSAITKSLFERNKSSWETALAEVSRLYNAAQRTADKKTLIAARDLCLKAGEFDKFDFCADLPDNTAINNIDLICLQNYWQNSGGKPAGALYPRSVSVDRRRPSVIKSGMTWGSYKSAVNILKNKTKSSNAREQRQAIIDFYGVVTGLNPFTPPVAGLQLWLDALDGRSLQITDRSLVVSWNNKVTTPINRNLTQNNFARQPKYVPNLLNGKPGIRFEGSQSLMMTNMDSVIANATQGFTVFVLEQRGNKPNQNNFFIGGSSTGQNENLILGYRSNNLVTMSFGMNFIDTRSRIPFNRQGATALDLPRIWCFQYTGTTRSIRLNGAPAGSGGVSAPVIRWPNPALGLNQNIFYDGVIYEVLFYRPALNNQDIERIEAYLATKWGLLSSLDSRNPYKTSGI